MAELASLLLAIGGGVELAAKTSSAAARLIHDWKDAPIQVASLSEEIKCSRHTVSQLEELCKGLDATSIDLSHANAINKLLQRAEPLWSKLEEILESLSTRTGHLRKERWMRSARKVDTLRMQLREVRFAALEILCICNLSINLRIEAAMVANQNSQHAWYESTRGSLADILSRMETIKPPGDQKLSEDQITQSNTLSEYATPRITQVAVQHLNGPGGGCKFPCTCRCHFGKQYDQICVSPFDGIFGSVAMIYSGWRLMGPRCDVLSCRKASLRFLRVTYSTPPQPLSFSVIASLKLGSDEPTIELDLRRTTSIVDEHDTQSIISCARAGNVHDMKAILEGRSDAIFDIIGSSGFSSLHFALDCGYIDVSKVLLAAGADPFLEDRWGRPAVLWGFHQILHASSSQKQNEWKDCLPISAFFEGYNFSHIELVVLGIRPLNLQVELNKTMHRAQLNTQDDLGKTPLHWAAAREDVLAVATILLAGARVDIPCKVGHTALFEACLSGSEACAEKLIAFGANTNVRDKLGYGLLQAAAEGSTSAGLLSLLLSKAGNKEDSRNQQKATPLIRAIQFHNKLSCKVLLDQGAYIEQTNRAHDTPLFEAILFGSYSCLQLLLDYNANYHHRNGKEQTLLHLAARKGEARTFKILAAANLKGFDVSAKDVLSMSAREYFELRPGLPQETVEAFTNLVEGLEVTGKGDGEKLELESNGSEDYFDALDNI